MEKAPKISIIIPAYNVEKYIEQCIRSVLEQTYKNIELIVVDDGSKDNTSKIIEELCSEDSRIVFIKQKNSGVAAARNVALQRVTSEYIMFLDSDDWLDKETCENNIKIAQEKNADIVMFGYVREYKKKSMPQSMFNDDVLIFEGDCLKDKMHRRVFGLLGEELNSPEKLDANTPIWTCMYNAEILKGLQFINIEELGMCEDGYFNISAFSKAKKIVFIKKYFYHYRKVINGLSLTQKKDNNVYERAKKFYKKLYEVIEKNNLSEDYKKAADNRLALCLLGRLNFQNIVYKNVKWLLNDEDYKKVISVLEFKYLPVHWKIFFWFAKIRFTLVVYLMLKAISVLLMIR